jgi:DNA-binding NarL/FixJ family response regulator
MSTRVVIVDDVSDMRFLVRQRIEDRGAEVVGEASTPEEAFELVARTAPDAVVTDLFLSSEDPTGYVRRLRDLLPSGSIVLMSAAPPADPAIRRALASGADGYFDKTEGFGALADGLLRLCRERRGNG